MFRNAINENKNDVITNTFLLTINSNKSAKDMETAENLKRILISKIKELFNDFDNFIDIFYAGHYINRKKAEVNFSSVARNIKVNPQFEIGQRQKRIHSHIVVKWDSYAKYFFQINVRKMREWFHRNGLPVHIDIKWIKGDSELFRYINKSHN